MEAPKENLFEKGEKRYEKISDSLSGAKSKISGWWNSAKSSVGFLFKRSLSAPEVAGKAWDVSRDATLDTIAAADEKIHQGIDYVGTKAGEGLEWADNKLDQVTAWSFDKAGKLEDWIAKKAQEGKEVAEMTAFVAGKVAALAAERTEAAYEHVKNSMSDGYEKAVTYGKNALEAAQMKKQQISDKWNLFKNSMRIGMLKAQQEKEAEKFMQASADKEAAEAKMRDALQKIKDIDAKMAMLRTLSVTPDAEPAQAMAA